MLAVAGNIRHDLARVGQQGMCRLGQGRAIGRPVKQFQIGLFFEFLDRVGDRRLCPVQMPRGGGEASEVGNGDEDP